MTVACPECQSQNSKVLDNRHRGNGTRRRRECENGHRFITFEVVVPSNTHKYTVQVIVHRTLVKEEVHSSVTIGEAKKSKTISKPKVRSVDDLNNRQKASLEKLRQKILERRNDKQTKASNSA